MRGIAVAPVRLNPANDQSLNDLQPHLLLPEGPNAIRRAITQQVPLSVKFGRSTLGGTDASKSLLDDLLPSAPLLTSTNRSEVKHAWQSILDGLKTTRGHLFAMEALPSTALERRSQTGSESNLVPIVTLKDTLTIFRPYTDADWFDTALSDRRPFLLVYVCADLTSPDSLHFAPLVTRRSMEHQSIRVLSSVEGCQEGLRKDELLFSSLRDLASSAFALTLNHDYSWATPSAEGHIAEHLTLEDVTCVAIRGESEHLFEIHSYARTLRSDSMAPLALRASGLLAFYDASWALRLGYESSSLPTSTLEQISLWHISNLGQPLQPLKANRGEEDDQSVAGYHFRDEDLGDPPTATRLFLLEYLDQIIHFLSDGRRATLRTNLMISRQDLASPTYGLQSWMENASLASPESIVQLVSQAYELHDARVILDRLIESVDKSQRQENILPQKSQPYHDGIDERVQHRIYRSMLHRIPVFLRHLEGLKVAAQDGSMSSLYSLQNDALFRAHMNLWRYFRGHWMEANTHRGQLTDRMVENGTSMSIVDRLKETRMDIDQLERLDSSIATDLEIIKLTWLRDVECILTEATVDAAREYLLPYDSRHNSISPLGSCSALKAISGDDWPAFKKLGGLLSIMRSFEIPFELPLEERQKAKASINRAVCDIAENIIHYLESKSQTSSRRSQLTSHRQLPSVDSLLPQGWSVFNYLLRLEGISLIWRAIRQIFFEPSVLSEIISTCARDGVTLEPAWLVDIPPSKQNFIRQTILERIVETSEHRNSQPLPGQQSLVSLFKPSSQPLAKFSIYRCPDASHPPLPSALARTILVTSIVFCHQKDTPIEEDICKIATTLLAQRSGRIDLPASSSRPNSVYAEQTRRSPTLSDPSFFVPRLHAAGLSHLAQKCCFLSVSVPSGDRLSRPSSANSSRQSAAPVVLLRAVVPHERLSHQVFTDEVLGIFSFQWRIVFQLTALQRALNNEKCNHEDLRSTRYYSIVDQLLSDIRKYFHSAAQTAVLEPLDSVIAAMSAISELSSVHSQPHENIIETCARAARNLCQLNRSGDLRFHNALSALINALKVAMITTSILVEDGRLLEWREQIHEICGLIGCMDNLFTTETEPITNHQSSRRSSELRQALDDGCTNLRRLVDPEAFSNSMPRISESYRLGEVYSGPSSEGRYGL